MKDKKWLIIGIIIIGILFFLKFGNEIMLSILDILMCILLFGTLFMPYIIGIVISVIIIFLIRKKLKEKDKNFKIFVYAIIIIVCIIVCRNIGYTAMLYLSEKPDKVYTEMKELSDSEKLIGLSKEEVIELLGEPLKSSRDNLYIYDAGTLTNYLFLGEKEFYDLFVWFDESDIVKSTEIHLPLGG